MTILAVGDRVHPWSPDHTRVMSPKGTVTHVYRDGRSVDVLWDAPAGPPTQGLDIPLPHLEPIAGVQPTPYRPIPVLSRNRPPQPPAGGTTSTLSRGNDINPHQIGAPPETDVSGRL